MNVRMLSFLFGFLAVFLWIACNEGKSSGESNAKKKNVATYKYSEKKIRLIGIDKDGMTFSKYEGKVTQVIVQIKDVAIKKDSSSVVVENDRVKFEILGDVKIPHSEAKEIELWFDEHGLLEPKPFEKNDIWIIEFGEKGEFLNILFKSDKEI